MSTETAVRILPDPAQIAAADPRQSVFVTANAGSGKTSTLVDRVARLLLEDVSPGEILCVTYTKAAAAEMQARLFDRLGAWAVMDDATLEASLADLDGRAATILSKTDLSNARRLFAKALDTPGGLKIQTLHAFCEKLLRRFPLEAGVTPGFTVLEDQAATALSHEAREDLARRALGNGDGEIGRAYAHFAVELDFKSFEGLLARIEADRARLLDYVARVDAGTAPGPHALVGADPDRDVATIQNDFMRFLDHGEWLAMAEAMDRGSVTDQACAKRMWEADWSFPEIASVFLTSGAPRKSMATKSAPPEARDWLTTMQDKVVATLGEVRKARVAEDTGHVLTLARAHGALYEAAKERRGALDFGDLVARTVELLTVRSSAAWVLFKLDGGIEHVLIDEAQDTAPEQWDIVEALTEGFFSGIGSKRYGAGKVERTVFAVGDEKQSIYSFQGARPERLRQESQRYDVMVRGAGAAFAGVELATSFRSTPEVLSFVDAVFVSPERTRSLVGETVGAIPAHIAKRVDDHGCIDLWPLYADEKPPERDAWDDPLDQEPVQSARKRMAADLAREIRRQVMAGVAVQDRKTRALRPCGYGDFLVLVRRRDATFEEIIRAMKAVGVPVAGADRLKLSSHIAFDDLIAVARVALYPDDELSLAGVLRSPLCDIPDDGAADSLYELAGADPKRKRLWAALQARAGEHPSWGRAHDLIDFAIASSSRDPFAFFAGLLNRIDATGLSGRARILARLGREAEEAIDETLNQVLAAEQRGGIDLETCLSMLETADVEVKREMEGARGEVRVMTVHGAKGLEAPVVILPDTTAKAKAQGPTLMPVELDDGAEGWLMCPGSEKEDCEASGEARTARQTRVDDETLRLLYVALTRARDRVVILGRGSAKSKLGYDEGSWWAVLTETFERLGGQVRDIGDGRRRFGVDPVVMAAGVASAIPGVTVPDWARAMPPVDPSARYVSPSQAKAVKRVSAPSPLAVAGADGGAPLGRFRRGDLIHLLLERLPEIEAAARPDAPRRMLARERDLSEAQRDEMIAAAFAVLEDARFSAVFGAGSRAEVALTGSAPGLPAGVSISGRIDRLVVTPERVLVVDYKTNRPAPDRIEDADPAYVAQMAVYVAVLKRLYPDRPVEAALVWTDGPRLMAVPQGVMDEALAGL
ncbi:double-strand break repair helicase AddA [Brevundimonas subvibrioides]|uniref:DNA 3'-5' helicase n=1 Tax=Brevundimonas subvibrioides (strain ATCC 15264 / DSM 4735 / LMG 14903 / NBRC 16000 / CB 81) TaxID=633149 RepID=D9QFG6_BRESC|nr:double-strand break repair helicase AddA [Brevundimonas subvibrioides]ADL02481.1 double-strand break repair helicase AddA [Brevundimonas subvibrioides ATCC 15264]